MSEVNASGLLSNLHQGHTFAAAGRAAVGSLRGDEAKDTLRQIAAWFGATWAKPNRADHIIRFAQAGQLPAMLR